MTHAKPPLSETPRRILLIRLSAHGDTAQTLPLLSALKQQAPDAFVGWLVEAGAAPLLQNLPLIDRLHVADRKRWLGELKQSVLLPWRWGQAARTLGEMRAFLQALHDANYDVSLDVQGLLKSALWPWLAKIPRRIGYARAREGASRLYTETLAPMEIRNATQSAVWKYLEFLPPLGLTVPQTLSCVLPPEPPETREALDRLLSPLNGLPVIALAPATRWPSKHWPVQHWQTLLGQLLAAGYGVLLLGSPEDVALNASVRAGVNAEHPRLLDLSGKTRLNALYGLMQRVDVLVGPDSAPLHIADAVSHSGEKPTLIALFGPTAPGRTGPSGPRHQVLATSIPCQPCFERVCPIQTHECLQALLPAQVMSAIQHVLGSKEVLR